MVVADSDTQEPPETGTEEADNGAQEPAERTQEPPPAPEPSDTISGRTALGVIGAFGLVLVGSLVVVAISSHAHYSQGIDATIAADPEHTTVIARRVFLLASGHQIMLFKAIAYGMAIMLALSGIVLVLNGAKAAYQLSTHDEKVGVKAALTTTSPGLAVITLAVALAAATLASKSSLQDHPDWDLQSQALANTDDSSSTEQQRIDELRREQRQRLADQEQPPLSPKDETEAEKLERIDADRKARDRARNAQ